jgi:hypothetical protein
MCPKRKARLLDRDRSATAPVSNVSPDEEARFLRLADLALHNPPKAADNRTQDLDDHLKEQREELTDQIRDAQAKFEREKKSAT